MTKPPDPLRPPLWMPEGSVRAVLALLAVLGAVVATMMGLEKSDVLIGLAGPVLGYYFGRRETETVQRQNGNGDGNAPR